MTNYEKYKTAKERVEAFWKYYKGYIHGAVEEFAKWLDLKAEEHIENCPYCGSECECRSTWVGKYRVACSNPDCWYSANIKSSVSDAINSHNCIARAATKGKEANKAAAPELYDAVAGLLGWWDREENSVPPHDTENPQKYIDAMRIAFCKANGESNEMK